MTLQPRRTRVVVLQALLTNLFNAVSLRAALAAALRTRPVEQKCKKKEQPHGKKKRVVCFLCLEGERHWQRRFQVDIFFALLATSFAVKHDRSYYPAEFFCLTFERILEKSSRMEKVYYNFFLGVLKFRISDSWNWPATKYQKNTPLFQRGLSLARVYPYSLSAPEIPTADDDRVHVT